jgi:hypothetical protein
MAMSSDFDIKLAILSGKQGLFVCVMPLAGAARQRAYFLCSCKESSQRKHAPLPPKSPVPLPSCRRLANSPFGLRQTRRPSASLHAASVTGGVRGGGKNQTQNQNQRGGAMRRPSQNK